MSHRRLLDDPDGPDRESRRGARSVGPTRFRALRRGSVLGVEVPIASGFRARLLGLAHLDRAAAGPGLLLPRCSSVHTFGMRFALDLFFLDREGALVEACPAVPPRRLAACRGAAAVLELPADPGRRADRSLFPAPSAERRGERNGPPGP